MCAIRHRRQNRPRRNPTEPVAATLFSSKFVKRGGQKLIVNGPRAARPLSGAPTPCPIMLQFHNRLRRWPNAERDHEALIRSKERSSTTRQYMREA